MAVLDVIITSVWDVHAYLFYYIRMFTAMCAHSIVFRHGAFYTARYTSSTACACSCFIAFVNLLLIVYAYYNMMHVFGIHIPASLCVFSCSIACTRLYFFVCKFIADCARLL